MSGGISMTRRIDPLTVALGVVTLGGCGVGALAGLGIFLLGMYGFVVGMHGGPIMSSLIMLCGATLMFLSYYLGRTWLKSERDRTSGAASEVSKSSDAT